MGVGERHRLLIERGRDAPWGEIGCPLKNRADEERHPLLDSRRGQARCVT
jgi:hypothetical protein